MKAFRLITVFILTAFQCSTEQFPKNLDEAVIDSGFLGGSTGVQKVMVENFGTFILKTGIDEVTLTSSGKHKNSRDHILGEYSTNKIYQVLGIPVPNNRLYFQPGRVFLLSVFLEGMPLGDFLNCPEIEDFEKEQIRFQIKKGFAADCLLGNYDVIGLERDNILVCYDDESGCYIPVRIDNGSGLEFEAQGAVKDPEFWGPVVTELGNMRNPDFPYHPAIRNAGEIFYDISDEELSGQIEELIKKKDEMLQVLPEKYHSIVIKRLDYLEKYGK